MSTQTTKEEAEKLQRRVQADAKFREKVLAYEKQTLAYLLCDMAPMQYERRRVLHNLFILQDLGFCLGSLEAPETKPLVLQKISELAGELSAETSCRLLETIGGFAGQVHTLAEDAHEHAGAGKHTIALDILLEAAATIAHGVAWHLKHNAEGLQKNAAVHLPRETPAMDNGHKKAGSVAAEPAGTNDESTTTQTHQS
jgi:hypothetical protein